MIAQTEAFVKRELNGPTCSGQPWMEIIWKNLRKPVDSAADFHYTVLMVMSNCLV